MHKWWRHVFAWWMMAAPHISMFRSEREMFCPNVVKSINSNAAPHTIAFTKQEYPKWWHNPHTYHINIQTHCLLSLLILTRASLNPKARAAGMSGALSMTPTLPILMCIKIPKNYLHVLVYGMHSDTFEHFCCFCCLRASDCGSLRSSAFICKVADQNLMWKSWPWGDSPTHASDLIFAALLLHPGNSKLVSF